MRHETVRIDCRKKSDRQVLNDLAGKLTNGGRRFVIVVENLLEIEGSVAALLKDLVRAIVEKGIRASLVDRSGCAAAFLDAIRAPISAVQAGEPKRILVVEDHEDSLEFLSTLLESAGHEAVLARTAGEAIAKLESSRFDLVILDLVLPDADGLTVAERAAGTRVVVVSAYLDRCSDEAYRRLHIQKKIAKPYRVKDILEAI